MLDSDLLEEDTTGILQAGLDGSGDDLLLVNPSRDTIQALITELSSTAAPPTVRLFVDRTALKELTDDFLIASSIAELVATGDLAVRTLETVPRSSLLLTDEFLTSIVESPDSVVGLTTTDESFVKSVFEEYDERWSRADPYNLRTPALSQIRETLAEEIGELVVDDFDRVLSKLDSARGNGDGIDEVTITLLVAANNGELLYDISRWGEGIGLASKATFSRAKNQLEDEGLIETEKVPIDVGRPRLRLLPGTEGLEESSIDAIVDEALTRLV